MRMLYNREEERFMKNKNINVKDLFSVEIIVILTIIFFSSILFDNNYRIPWDAFDQQYPWLNSMVSTISSGNLPLWSDNFFSRISNI